MSRKKHPEHVNHERWLVSYADFITLLFAFFVVLFASSQSDKKKQINSRGHAVSLHSARHLRRPLQNSTAHRHQRCSHHQRDPRSYHASASHHQHRNARRDQKHVSPSCCRARSPPAAFLPAA